MKKSTFLLLTIALALLAGIYGCDPDEQIPDPDPTPTYPSVMKCLINGVQYTATSISSSGSYASGVPVAKGILHSNGNSTMDGDIRWRLNFGTDNQGIPLTGAHTMVTQMGNPDNYQGKATFKDFYYFNNNTGFVIENTGVVTVSEYYFRSSDNTYLGAKGTFDNIQVCLWDANTQTFDTLVFTQGVFDFKQNLP